MKLRGLRVGRASSVVFRRDTIVMAEILIVIPVMMVHSTTDVVNIVVMAAAVMRIRWNPRGS